MKYLLIASLVFAQTLSAASSDYWNDWSPSGSGEFGDLIVSLGGGASVPFDAEIQGFNADMDTSPAATLGVTYLFKELQYMYVGADFTYYNSEVQSIGGISMDSLFPGQSNSMDVYNGFVNIGLALPVGDRLHLLIGGGAGVGFFNSEFKLAGEKATKEDTLFIYKAEMTVMFNLTDSWILSGGYKYIAPASDIKTPINGAELEDFGTNVFTVSLGYKF